MRLLRKQGTLKRLIWTGALFIMTIALAGVSPAAGLSGTAAPFLPRAGQEFAHRADLRKVLLVVEHRTKDEKVLEKMRNKLTAMSDRELRLAVSLCERIARDDESAGSDIAFSIVMALVVLS
jgi:hypothetical protein